MSECVALNSIFEYRRIAHDETDSYIVSTIWLGLDHNWSGEGPPIIFESMVFSRSEWEDPEHDGLRDIDSARYSTLEEAQAGHAKLLALVKANEKSLEEMLQDDD